MPGTNHEGRRNADALIVAALARGATHKQAADTAGVAVRTVRRRLSEKGFRDRIDNQRLRLLERSAGLISKHLAQATGVIATLAMEGENEAVKLRAAEAILTHAVRFRELMSQEVRLKELEAVVRVLESRGDLSKYLEV